MPTAARPRTRPLARLASACVLTLAALLHPAVGHGQNTTTYRVTQVSHNTALCGTTSTATNGAGADAAGCSEGDFTFAAFAEAADGRTRARASLGATTPLAASPPGLFDRRKVLGEANWADRLTVTRGDPVAVDVLMCWSGYAFARVASGTPNQPFEGLVQADAYATWSFAAATSTGIPLGDAYGSGAGTRGVALGNYQLQDADSAAFAVQQSVRVPLVGTSGAPLAAVFLTHSLRATVDLQVFNVAGVGGSRPYTVTAWVDASRTGLIQGLVFRDAAGNDVTNQVDYTFANGTRVGPEVSTVPEPTTLVLAAVGLAGLALAAQRRRAA